MMHRIISATKIPIAILTTLVVNFVTNGVLGFIASETREGRQTFWSAMQGNLHPFASWQYPSGFFLAPFIAVCLATFSIYGDRKRVLIVTAVIATLAVGTGLLVGRAYYGRPDTPNYLILFAVRVITVFMGSVLATLQIVKLVEDRELSSRRTRSNRTRGFTIVEILVVVLILAILTALLFPAYARAKKSTYISSDRAQMRQIYVAIKLYEEEGGDMPPNLTYLVPRYLPKEILHGADDVRPKRADGTYPAIMSCSEYREGVGSCPRSSYMVSYAYLPTFRRVLDVQGISLAELKTRPQMGLLTALHHADHTLLGPPFPPHDPSLGKLYNTGIFLRTHMDGSTKVVKKSVRAESYECSWESCFLN